MRKSWTRDDSLRMGYTVAIGQLIREIYRGQETEDIPAHLKTLLAQLETTDELETHQRRANGARASAQRRCSIAARVSQKL